MLAFFEVLGLKPMSRDLNTPAWVQHIALTVKDVDTLQRVQQRLVEHGIEVIGPTNHALFQSIYFFDPNGHRIELAADTSTPDILSRLHALAPQMLEEWSKHKRTVKHAAWLHQRKFSTHHN